MYTYTHTLIYMCYCVIKMIILNTRKNTKCTRWTIKQFKKKKKHYTINITNGENTNYKYDE